MPLGSPCSRSSKSVGLLQGIYRVWGLLGGSLDLVIRVTHKVTLTILVTPIQVLIALLAKSHGPSSTHPECLNRDRWHPCL